MTSPRYHNNAGLFNDSAFEVFNNPTFHRQCSMESKSTLFGSFKSRFSKKSPSDSHSSPSSSPTISNNPFSAPSSSTPRTRRPRDVGFATDSNDPPPPVYTAKPTGNDRPISEAPVPSKRTSNTVGSNNTIYNATNVSSTSAPIVASTDDDQYAFLSTFDTVFLIDDSGSMAGRSWRESSLALETITPICTAHDADGIDVYFLNTPDSPHYHNVTLASTVHEIFSTVKPSGGTPTGQVLNRILKQYLARYEADRANVKPMNIIVITDGVPSDDVESVIINAAKKLDRLDAEPWQIGIQMFQTGEEQGAKEHLESLDDELSRMGGGCRDIVDTVPFRNNRFGRGIGLTGEDILKVVLGAVNKRLDRRPNNRAAANRPTAN